MTTDQPQEEAVIEQIRRRQEQERAKNQTTRTLKQALVSDLAQRRAEWNDERCREYERRQAEMEEADRRRRLSDTWNLSGVGRRFRASRLDNYLTPTDAHASAVSVCREVVDAFGTGGGVLLLGDPEGGKTHLLCGMLFEAAQRGQSIRYITAEDFYLGLRSRMDKGLSESGFIDGLVRPDVLALDDLYCLAAAKSAHEESYQYRMLWTLLDRRYRDAKSTITSTNKPLAEFKEMLDERTRRRLEAKVVRVPKRRAQ